MSDFEKLPFHVRRVIIRCRSGQKLCIQHRVKSTGEAETSAYFEPSGKAVGIKGALAAIKTDLLAPAGDGLFGEESSQVWVAP